MIFLNHGPSNPGSPIQVSVHVSMHGMEKDAITLQQSLWDGRLRQGPGTSMETWCAAMPR